MLHGVDAPELPLDRYSSLLAAEVVDQNQVCGAFALAWSLPERNRDGFNLGGTTDRQPWSGGRARPDWMAMFYG